jgi:uncharacterized protein YcfL
MGGKQMGAKLNKMNKYIIIILALFTLMGCATKTQIEYKDKEVLKYIKSIQHDTLISNVHDSIYNNIYTKGDTVYNFKYKERIAYKDRIVYKNDTIKRDSIQTQYKENTIIKTKTAIWPKQQYAKLPKSIREH